MGHTHKLSPEMQKDLVKHQVEDHISYTVKNFVEVAENKIGKSGSNSNENNKVFSFLIDYINVNHWEIDNIQNDHKIYWQRGWKTVLDKVKRKVLNRGDADVMAGFKEKESDWGKLYTLLDGTGS